MLPTTAAMGRERSGFHTGQVSDANVLGLSREKKNGLESCCPSSGLSQQNKEEIKTLVSLTWYSVSDTSSPMKVHTACLLPETLIINSPPGRTPALTHLYFEQPLLSPVQESFTKLITRSHRCHFYYDVCDASTPI